MRKGAEQSSSGIRAQIWELDEEALSTFEGVAHFHDPDSALDVLIFGAPDALSCLRQHHLLAASTVLRNTPLHSFRSSTASFFERPAGNRAGEHRKPCAVLIALDGEARRERYGSERSLPKLEDLLHGRWLLVTDTEQWFLPVLVPICPVSLRGLLLWVEIDPITAEQLLETERANPRTETIYGIIANAVHILNDEAGSGPHLLYHGCKVQLDSLSLPGSRVPIAVGAALGGEDSPWPALQGSSDGASALALFDRIRECHVNRFRVGIAELQHALLCRDIGAALALVERHEHHWKWIPEAHFCCGLLALLCDDLALGDEACHRAEQLGHPLAAQLHFEILERSGQEVRKRYPEALLPFDQGEPERALTLLRIIAAEQGGDAAGALAYALRRAGLAAECLEATTCALLHRPHQPDVLGHRWRALFDLRQDDAAYRTAREHLLAFPRDAGALGNLLDSCIVTGRFLEAQNLLNRYRVLCKAPALFLRRLFAWAEATGEWQTAEEYFSDTLKRVPNLGPEILALAGEVLLECGRVHQALSHFERCQHVDAGESRLILGHARCLAQLGQEEDAEALLSAALADQNRVDRYDRLALLATLLAEIQRRTGRPDSAIRTIFSTLGTDLGTIARRAGPPPLIELAEGLLETGRTEEARAVARLAYQEFPEDPMVAELLSLTS